MKKPLLIIAAGGTGGHMFPAQALAEEMLQQGWRIKLSTDPRGARYTEGFPVNVDIEVVNSATFSRGGLFSKFLVPFKLFSGVLAVKKSMKKDRPQIVIGFGGYPAIPAMVAAGWLKIPRIIHEQNGVLGRVNKKFAKKVDVVACGVWPTDLPTGAKAIHVGNPVRQVVLDRAGANYIMPGDWPMNILAIGGSQGARIISEIMPKALAILPKKMLQELRVTQQARKEDVDNCSEAYDAIGVSADVQTFFDDIPSRLAEAQLVVSRAGASSVADISVIGRPSILIPLASAMDDHQTINARGLSSVDAAILIPETDLTPENLAKCIKSVLEEPEGARHMANMALSQGKPDAVKGLARLVQDLADKG